MDYIFAVVFSPTIIMTYHDRYTHNIYMYIYNVHIYVGAGSGLHFCSGLFADNHYDVSRALFGSGRRVLLLWQELEEVSYICMYV